MLAINLEPELERYLSHWAKVQGRSMDEIAIEAIREKIEELEDIALLDGALKDYDPSQNITMEEMRRKLGLDD